MDLRHWRFIWQSLCDLQQQLNAFFGQLLVVQGDITSILEQVAQVFPRLNLFSYQEIGLKHTFDRDLAVKSWCQHRQIPWREYQYGAVRRGLSKRNNWDQVWQTCMRAPTFDVDLQRVNWLPGDGIARLGLTRFRAPIAWQKQPPGFQLGGERRAWHTLHHFFKGRGKRYAFDISYPEAARQSCSRLSPYLAWGNISIKQSYQTLLKRWHEPGYRRSLAALSSRLHWHCHFIQKFESECAMEFRPVNQAYLNFQYQDGGQASRLLRAWQQGKTGVPLVDACMRCLQHTGYINFRMRAMLVSFLCHYLNINWREGVKHLARLFLDFEPGIHYPQFQMQAGVTGINLIRVYNPIKQAIDRDPEAIFIKKWLPELAGLPTELAQQPWLLSPLEAQMHQIELGVDYPLPIVDLDLAAKQAKQRLWAFRERDDVKAEGSRILKRHTVPATRHKYRRG